MGTSLTIPRFLQERNALDNITNRLYDVASNVKSVRNMLSPINRLPPELLCAIFLDVVRACPEDIQLSDDAPGYCFVERPYGILNSLQSVCRLWRNIIVSSPALYSRIVADETTPVVEVEEMLNRSGNIPQDVLFLCAEHMRDVLCSCRQRIRRLELMCSSEVCARYGDPSILDILTQRMPFLESFGYVWTTRPIFSKSPRLPPLFGGFAPHLTHLSVTHTEPWSTPGFPALVRLYVERAATNSIQSMEDFLNFLDRSPMLEEIVLVDAGPKVNIDSKPGVDTRRVELPRLHTVVLQGCSWITLRLLVHHVVPARDAALRATGIDDLMGAGYIARTLLKHCPFVSHAERPTELSVWLQSHGELTISYRSDVGSLDFSASPDCNPRALISMVGELIASTTEFLQLDGVLGLCMDVGGFDWKCDATKSHPLCELLRAMPSVQRCTFRVRVRKSWERGPGLLCRLSDDAEQCLLPSLRSLEIVRNASTTPSWQPLETLALASDRMKHVRRFHELICTEVYGGIDLGRASWDTEPRPSSRMEKVLLRDVADFVQIMYAEKFEDDPPRIEGWDGAI